MKKICKIDKENGITQEDNACFGPTDSTVYSDHILIPGNFLKSSFSLLVLVPNIKNRHTSPKLCCIYGYCRLYEIVKQKCKVLKKNRCKQIGKQISYLNLCSKLYFWQWLMQSLR